MSTISEQIPRAEENLRRKLEWVSRYDSRIPFVAGISIAMLGVLANASASVLCWNEFMYFTFGLAALFLFVSLVYIYKGQYPKPLAPNKSLIFFGTIARMKPDEFKDEFKQATDDDYLEDLLSQIHINAEILKQKFAYLQVSLVMVGFALLPWMTAIYLSKVYLK